MDNKMKLALLVLLPSNIDDSGNFPESFTNRFNLFDCVYVAASDINAISSESDCNFKFLKVKSFTVIDVLLEAIPQINADYVFLLCKSDKIIVDSDGIQVLRRIIDESLEPVCVFGAFEFYNDKALLGISAELSSYSEGMEREIFVNRELDKRYDSAISGLVLSKSILLKNVAALRLLSDNALSAVFISAINGTNKIYQIKIPTVIASIEGKDMASDIYITFYYYQWLFCKETFLRRRLLRKLFDTIFVDFKLNKMRHFIKIFSALNFMYKPIGFLSFPFAFIESACYFAGRRLAGIMRHL